MNSTARKLFLLSLVLMLAVVGCNNKDDKKETNTAKTAEPATVRLQLVSAQMSLAGMYGAIDQGFFADQNLTFEPLFSNVVDTSESLDIINRVVAGEAEFGLTSGDNLLSAWAQGKDVVAIMAIYQRDPTGIVSLANKNILTPEDLVGKKLLVFSRSITLNLFFAAAGINPDDVTLVEAPEGNINAGVTQFVSGQVDGMVANGTDVDVQMQAIGLDHNLIFFNDYGIQMYPNLIFTTANMIATQPDVVQRFVNAFLDGMNYAIGQPAEISTWFVENYSDQLRPDQVESQDDLMLAIIPLLQTTTNKPGTMTVEAWQYMADAMLNANMINDSTGFTQAYNTTFVDTYYSQK